MTRPLLLDAFCGAGGCSVGYHRAGFRVIGVDLHPQPNYPYDFIQADALEYLRECGKVFDAIHASPPCQAFTTMSAKHRGKGGKADSHPDLVGPTRDLLEATGKPWVIENVPGARSVMRHPFTLNGGAFGLGVDRPRLFETNWPIGLIPARVRVADPVGVYGREADGRRLFTRADGTEQRAAASIEQGRDAMGIDWMDWRELAQAIPPAYTEFIGEALLAHISTDRRIA